jgi:hypothetical protein
MISVRAKTSLTNATGVDYVWNVMAQAQNPDFLSAKGTSPFKSAGASVQSTTGSRGVRISGSNAGYTKLRGNEGYWLPIPFTSFPFPPMRHRVASRFNWTLLITDHLLTLPVALLLPQTVILCKMQPYTRILRHFQRQHSVPNAEQQVPNFMSKSMNTCVAIRIAAGPVTHRNHTTHPFLQNLCEEGGIE